MIVIYGGVVSNFLRDLQRQRSQPPHFMHPSSSKLRQRKMLMPVAEGNTALEPWNAGCNIAVLCPCAGKLRTFSLLFQLALNQPRGWSNIKSTEVYYSWSWQKQYRIMNLNVLENDPTGCIIQPSYSNWHFSNGLVLALWHFSASGLRLKTIWKLHISFTKGSVFQLDKFWSVQCPATFSSFRQVLKFCIKKTQRWWVDSCNPQEKALTTKTDQIQHWQSYQHPCRKHKEKSGHAVGKTQGFAWWDNPQRFCGNFSTPFFDPWKRWFSNDEKMWWFFTKAKWDVKSWEQQKGQEKPQHEKNTVEINLFPWFYGKVPQQNAKFIAESTGNFMLMACFFQWESRFLKRMCGWKFSQQPPQQPTPQWGKVLPPQNWALCLSRRCSRLNLSTPLATEVMGVSCDEFPKLKDGPSLGMKELKDLAVLHRVNRVNRVDTSPSSIRDCWLSWPERRLSTMAKRAKPVTMRSILGYSQHL